MLYHPDTATGALSQKRTTLAFDANAPQKMLPLVKLITMKDLRKEKYYIPLMLLTMS